MAREADTRPSINTFKYEIKEEPQYTEDEQRYCLYVIERDQSAFWIVLDGNTAYVDINQNGILGEDGESHQFADAPFKGMFVEGPDRRTKQIPTHNHIMFTLPSKTDYENQVVILQHFPKPKEGEENSEPAPFSERRYSTLAYHHELCLSGGNYRLDPFAGKTPEESRVITTPKRLTVYFYPKKTPLNKQKPEKIPAKMKGESDYKGGIVGFPYDRRFKKETMSKLDFTFPSADGSGKPINTTQFIDRIC